MRDRSTAEMTYIYALTDSDTGIERYVGKADDPYHRYQEHLRPSSLCFKTHKNAWLKSLLKQGKCPGIKILLCCLNVKCVWENCERFFIALYRIRQTRDILTNTHDGGEGGGHPCSEETKQKLSIVHKGRISPTEGMTRSEETKRKISEAYRGEKHPNAKFTEAEVLEIRRLSATGQYTQRELAKQFATTHGVISNIITRHSWKHLLLPGK